METFLSKVAVQIWSTNEVSNLKDLAIVMPSQRGVLYLKKELGYLSDKPFLSPSFFTIEEFSMEMTNSKLVDPLSLLLEAFYCFKEVNPQVDFDRFISWGQMMLKDFDTLDMYLVDPFQIFSFLSEVKSLERWGEAYGEENPEKWITPNTQNYFKLYDYLLEVYGRLKSRLADQGMVYRGLAYRKLAENIASDIPLPSNFKNIYFVGFNALSKAEEEIMKALLKKGMAETLWDADEYYVNNPFHRAGNWLRNYSNPSKTEYLARGNFQWLTKDLLEKPKYVQILGVANPSAQVFLAMDIIRKWQNEFGSEEQVALVLADEGLLDQILLYVGEFSDRLNITMGYSLKKTQVFSLLNDCWNFIQHSENEKYPIALFNNVLNHPLIKRLVTHWSKKNKFDLFLWLSKQYSKNDLYLTTQRLFSLNPVPSFFHDLFQSPTKDFLKILSHFKKLLTEILLSTDQNDWDQEAEAIHQALAVIEKMEINIHGRDPLSIKSGKLLLTQMLQQQKLTFEGSEKRSLHVMGLLESRTLDFDRVIVLSMNEGSLPGTRKRESLIPTDIANMAQFELPTFTQADAVASYHFYRLLQRPQEVVLCYVQPSEKSNVKEMSRFIKQLKYEWKRKNSLITFYEPAVTFQSHDILYHDAKVAFEKTPEIIQQIKQTLAKKGLSASSISMFSSCSLKYYYHQILGLKKEKSFEDEMGADVFGTWIHKVLELIDKEVMDEFDGNYDLANLEQKIPSIDDYLAQAMEKIKDREGAFELEKGFNYVLQEVAKTLLVSYFKLTDISKNVRLLALEETLTHTLEVVLGPETIPVKITGRIDRIDIQSENTVRIIDYKTGKVDKKDLKSGDDGLISAILTGDFKDKLFQLWLYKYLLVLNLKDPTKSASVNEKITQLRLSQIKIKPGIISFRNLSEEVMFDEEQDLWFTRGQDWDSFISDSQKVVTGWVQKILDPEVSFEKTSQITRCQFCDFKVICQREL